MLACVGYASPMVPPVVPPVVGFETALPPRCLGGKAHFLAVLPGTRLLARPGHQD